MRRVLMVMIEANYKFYKYIINFYTLSTMTTVSPLLRVGKKLLLMHV